MAAVPQGVLSERVQEAVRGRRLISAVFLTFKFDPAFFEQEVLPVLFDLPLHHAPAKRLHQLEEVLRGLEGEIAVYYDANGLAISDEGSAKLDVRRIPIQLKTGIFHAKNVFLLVEEPPNGDGASAGRSLIAVSLSANLTRSGWWENVEVAHIEELAQGAKTRLRDDLIQFLDTLRRRVNVGDIPQSAVATIIEFLKKETEQRVNRSTGDELHTHFYGGREPLVDFIDRVAGDRVHGLHLEVLSPYLDDAGQSKPLQDLVDRFAPKGIRILLPRSSDGTAQCNQALYGWVKDQPGFEWGRLVGDIARRGQGDDAQPRFIHAKVYRFFGRNPSREVLFVGSANLTRPAFQQGGNVESGFLVELRPKARPEYWLEPDQRKPTEFYGADEADLPASSAGSRLRLRYHWDSGIAEAYWDDRSGSPELQLAARGVTVGAIANLGPAQWLSLDQTVAKELRNLLTETSLIQVTGDREGAAWLLVQEEAMSHKPSVLVQWSVADILRFWATLSVEQRAALIALKFSELSMTATGRDLIARVTTHGTVNSFFDSFAGIFHAFGCLERRVRDALILEREKEAAYLMFGSKYDSLPTLLEKLAKDGSGGDIDSYVIALCTRQVCTQVEREHVEFWGQHSDDVKIINTRLKALEEIRQRLISQDPKSMDPFLHWFERWFLKRAKPVEVERD